MATKPYHTFLFLKEERPVYIGKTSSIEEAEKLAKRHENEEILGLPEWQWNMCQKTGNGNGLFPPPPTEEKPETCFGNYCVFIEI